jgi:cell division protein FtsB
MTEQESPGGRRSKPFWAKALYLLIAFFLLWILLLFFTGERGLLTFFRSRDTTDDLKTQIEQIRRENELLKQKIEKLIKDTAEIERLAREQLGMVKPGEKVYFFVQEEPNKKPPAPTPPQNGKHGKENRQERSRGNREVH